MTAERSKTLLNFIDPGASADEPVKGITNGMIRQWYDRIDRLVEGLSQIHDITQISQDVPCWQKIQNIESTAAATLGRDLLSWED